MNNEKEQFVTFLQSVYSETNEHLREQGKKRDQVILFVLVLISFYLTAKKNLVVAFGGNLTYSLMGFGLALITIIATVELADLRGWHQQYIDCIYVLNFIFGHLEDYESVQEMIQAIRKLSKHDETKNNKKFSLKKLIIGSTDNDVYTVMILLSAAIFLIPIHQFLGHINLITWALYLLIVIIYLYWMEIFLQKKLTQAATYLTWPVDFEYRSNSSASHSIFVNKYFHVTEQHNYLHILQKTGGVVMLPMVENKFLLIYIKRSDNLYHWELPRGFSEKDETVKIAAQRELNEELNIAKSDINVIKNLGKLQTDSGLVSDSVSAVFIKIFKLENIKLQQSEHLQKAKLFSTLELQNMITNNEITDNFTLATLMKFSEYNKKSSASK